MLISLILFVLGLVVGYYLRVIDMILCSALVTISYAVACVMLAKVGFVSVIMFFALLTALQGGYLLGAYLLYRTERG